MLVDLTFDIDKMNAKSEVRGLRHYFDTHVEDGREFQKLMLHIDLDHEFWQDQKWKLEKTDQLVFIREGTGLYWTHELKDVIRNSNERCEDDFASYNSLTGRYFSRKMQREFMDMETFEEQDASGYSLADMGLSSYGVSDNIEQILTEYHAVLANPELKTVIQLSPVSREHQSSNGGWRWHKNGRYIGTQKPTHEYLYDDTHIDTVIMYHVFSIQTEEVK